MVNKRVLCLVLISTLFCLAGAFSAASARDYIDDLEMLFGMNYVEIPLPKDRVRHAKFVIEIHAADGSDPVVFEEAVIFDDANYINGQMWAGIVYGQKPLVQGRQEVLLILGNKGEQGSGRTTFTINLADYGFAPFTASALVFSDDMEVKLNTKIPVYHIYPDNRIFSGSDPADIDALLTRYDRIFVLSVALYDHIPNEYLQYFKR
jgi:hypothetical protein